MNNINELINKSSFGIYFIDITKFIQKHLHKLETIVNQLKITIDKNYDIFNNKLIDIRIDQPDINYGDICGDIEESFKDIVIYFCMENTIPIDFNFIEILEIFNNSKLYTVNGWDYFDNKIQLYIDIVEQENEYV